MPGLMGDVTAVVISRLVTLSGTDIVVRFALKATVELSSSIVTSNGCRIVKDGENVDRRIRCQSFSQL